MGGGFKKFVSVFFVEGGRWSVSELTAFIYYDSSGAPVHGKKQYQNVYCQLFAKTLLNSVLVYASPHDQHGQALCALEQRPSGFLLVRTAQSKLTYESGVVLFGVGVVYFWLKTCNH